MKRYFVFVCMAVMYAFSAQAVTLSFAISSASADGVTIAGSDIYAIAVYYNPEPDSSWKLANAHFDDLDIALEGYNDDDASMAARGTIDDWNEGFDTLSWGESGVSGTLNADFYYTYANTTTCYFVIFNKDGTFIQSAALFYDAENDLLYDNAEFTGNPLTEWNPASDSWASAGLVPEPTSLVLLAIGVAGISLRRRVKK